VRFVAGGGADVEDVLHDVFLIVYRKVRWLREPESFRAWVYRIAARQALRACRARDAQLTDEECQAMRPHQALAPDREILLESARQRIGELPPASRAVLSLHYLEGLTLEDAASVLGIPVGTAKSRLSSGIARLRVWLGAGG
jgi:RNA polymerase sigma-70 factor (ECF subfamily)